METKTKKKFRFSKKILPLFLVATLLISVAFAFLTAHDSLNNKFSLSTLKIEVSEPSFPSTLNINVQPGQTVAKDPQIINGTSTTDTILYPSGVIGSGANTFMYAAIQMPVANIPFFVEDANEDTGWRYVNNGGTQDIFDLKYNNTNGINTTDWTLLGVDNSTLSSGYRTYYYSYNNVVASGARTSEIFDHVYMKNFANQFYNDYDAVAAYLENYIHPNFSNFQSNVSGVTYAKPDAGNNGQLSDPNFSSSAYQSYKSAHQNDAQYQRLDGTLYESKLKVDWYLSISGYTYDEIVTSAYENANYTVVEGDGVNTPANTLTFVSGNHFTYDFIIGDNFTGNDAIYDYLTRPVCFVEWLDQQDGQFVTRTDLSGTIKHLVVTGYAIQSDNLPEGIDTPAEAWPILINQTAQLSASTPGNTPAQSGNG